jgi:hypothetical protein
MWWHCVVMVLKKTALERVNSVFCVQNKIPLLHQRQHHQPAKQILVIAFLNRIGARRRWIFVKNRLMSVRRVNEVAVHV